MSKPLSIYKISLLHKCPCCGKGGIYASLLAVKDKCVVCNFSLKEHDAGDGPAFFAMFIVGIVVTVLAVMVDFLFNMSIWLHMLIWTPIIILMSIYLLKVMKSFLIAMQYNKNVLGFAKRGKK